MPQLKEAICVAAFKQGGKGRGLGTTRLCENGRNFLAKCMHDFGTEDWVSLKGRTQGEKN